MSGLYAMFPLHGLQARQASDDQPLFVLLAPIDHAVNMLRQNFSGLHYHRLIVRLQLLIDGQCTFDGGGCNRLFHHIGDLSRLRSRAPIACDPGT